jgi:hypothetical protein
MRRILSGAIEHPHFGQTVLSASLTFSRLIFCFFALVQPALFPRYLSFFWKWIAETRSRRMK